MARSCTICIHRRRDAMDKMVLRGDQLKAVARRYSVSEDALGRHRKHMRAVMEKAAAMVEQKEVAYGSALLAEVGRIRADAERLQAESERRRDVRGALRAIHERLAVVELEAKLSGQIDGRQKNELHLHFPPDRALAVAEAYVARHGSARALPEFQMEAPPIEAQEVE